MSVIESLDSQFGEARQGRERSRTPGRAQLPRLLELIMALQSDRFPNARILAERCEVSRRTIYRDLETLEAAGIPVRYRPERQGYQLARGCSVPTSGLDETEALALVILVRQWKGGAAFDLLRHARDGAVKVIQALPPEARDRVLTQAEPVPEENGLVALPRDRTLVYDTILEALIRRLQVRIWYRQLATPSGETTKLGIYRLVLARGTWLVVGRSSVHRDVKVFRIPWIDRVAVTDDPYTIPPRFNLERFLGMAWTSERGKDRHEVWLRFSARVAPGIRDTLWHRSQSLAELPDQRADLHLVIDGLDEIVGWVLSFGDQVEVLAPVELRQRVESVATRLVHFYAPPARSRLETGPA
jgi:predicted DNA-binding transcriptional regulator YafY